MKKRLAIYIFVLFTIFFLNGKEVRAGVCNDVEGQSYCTYPLGGFYFKRNLSDISGRTDSKAYFLRPGYSADIYGDYPAFCLDPGLSFPPSGKYYSNVREIDLSITYDDGVYRMYQKLLNDIKAGGNVNELRSYFQFAIRAWTLKNGYGYVNSSDAIYKYDASNFSKCVKNYIDSSLDMTRLNTLTGGSCSLEYGFGSEYRKNTTKAYYDMVGNSYLWKNPFDKDSNIWSEVTEPTADNPNYKYEFKVRFTDESRFYDDIYYQAVGALGLPEANFEAYIEVNGQGCLPESPCNANVYNNVGYVHPRYSNVQDVVTFSIEFTPEQYASYFPDGNGTIKLKYKYNHPMDSDNVFITRYDIHNALYQRMLVVQNYVHNEEKTVNIGTPVITPRYCEHTPSGFTDNNGNVVSGIDQFFSSGCPCEKVNTSLLSGTALDKYNAKCRTSVGTNNFTGGLYECDSSQTYKEASSDTNYENYSLGYDTTTEVNEYCTETCVEDIDIYNLKGKFQTKAGKYFNFTRYPELTATKTCTVNVDYSSWKTDYNNKLTTMVNTYNDWAKAASVTSSTSECDCHLVCGLSGCTPECYKTLYIYNYSYSKASVNADGVTLSTTIDSGTVTSCGSSIDWNVAGKSTSFQATIATIPTMQNKLEACNNKVFIDREDETFYDFEYELKYYYNQDYTKLGVVWNSGNVSAPNSGSNKVTHGVGIDDSSYKITNVVAPTGWNNLSSTNELAYDTINSSGSVNRKNIITQNSVTRYVKYNVKYIPKENKYIDAYTGEISLTASLNSTLLGNVYDTDATAKATSNNISRYEFTKLGATNDVLFNHFKNGSTIKRECTYKITSGLIEEEKPKFIYRIVDPDNVDPNNRMSSGDGFKNWTTSDIERIEDEDTFNPNNIQYTFVLNSSTIKDIREYNRLKVEYDDYDSLTCPDAEKCESSFVTTYAKVTDGRTIWD